MSERYSRLFTLPENLYAVGSPVVIAAGTLLKDNQTGKIVAQLKLRSISSKIIKAVKIRLYLFDTAGNPIGSIVEYEYLDLDVSRDTEFGQKNPVFVTENKARSYDVAVTEVVFSDRSVWVANIETWEPLSRPVPLKISDPELLKQYKIRFGNNSTYEPKEEKDLWYCTCGELNRTDEGCHCGNSLFELQTLDMAELVADKDARLAQEAAALAAEKAAHKSAAEAARKKIVKILKIVIPAVSAAAIIAVLLNYVIIPNNKYNKAVALMEEENYLEAIAVFEAMDGYKDSAEQIEKCQTSIRKAEDARIAAEKAEEAAKKEAENATAYADAETLAANGEYTKAGLAFGRLGDYRDSRVRSFEQWHKTIVQNRKTTISAGFFHTVAIQKDGSVVAVGSENAFDDEINDWSDVVAVSASRDHTVGLKSDGTVIASGSNNFGQCDVEDWNDIVSISTGQHHTVGLKSDGTVVAVGKNDIGQCNVEDWKDIIAISAGTSSHTVGLKSDGTVVAAGKNTSGQCNVDDWKDIVAISAGGGTTVGLKYDGTVVAVGTNDEGRCNVAHWSDVIAISAEINTAGLKADGTVLLAGLNDDNQYDSLHWSNIIAISSRNCHIVGLKDNGTLVSAGYNEFGQCDVSNWKDIKLPN